MKRRWALLISVLVTGTLFNIFAEEITDFNASVRTFVVSGNAETRTFDHLGLPLYRNARVGEYRSPFYVVHYGLEYSEVCRAQVDDSGYHWKEDETLEYWHSSPLEPSIELFRNSIDWVVKNTEFDEHGNAHLFYHFDWPYANHPGGVLRGPWWSGLADGHAITLLLRAADCFNDPVYSDLAEEFYRSVLTPVSQGGSMLTLNGLPWIEEYVDPSADEAGLSRVFNGMVYGYFGVTAFERFSGNEYASDKLRNSIIKNVQKFDKGFWSYYDAIGSEANIKYHRINLALLEDSRISGSTSEKIVRQWKVGATFPGFFYIINGPFSVAKVQFFLSLVLAWAILFVFMRSGQYFFARVSEKKWQDLL
jgi:hypothetical protein